MCEYCEKRIKNKKILDIDNETETHMEIINQKKSWGYMLYVEIEGEDRDGYKPSQFFQISYCPICRKEAGRVKVGIHKAKYRHSQWYYYIIPRRLTLKCNPPIYKWLWFVIDLSKEESYDK